MVALISVPTLHEPDQSPDTSHQFPFATIITKDYPDEEASGLDQDGAFRLNLGVSRLPHLRRSPPFDQVTGRRGRAARRRRGYAGASTENPSAAAAVNIRSS